MLLGKVYLNQRWKNSNSSLAHNDVVITVHTFCYSFITLSHSFLFYYCHIQLAMDIDNEAKEQNRYLDGMVSNNPLRSYDMKMTLVEYLM